VICVGDLINRGPESERALDFLGYDWFYTVRGNHEQDFEADVKAINEGGDHTDHSEEDCFVLKWIGELSNEDQHAFIDAFNALPYAIEVSLKGEGTAGFTHAEIPQELSWTDFIQKLEEGDDRVQKTALMGRSRIYKAYKNGYDTDPGVSGIERVFTGHSLAADRRVSQMGNWFCIDTGAVMRDLGTDGLIPKCKPEDLHLSLVDINAKAEELARVKPLDDNRPFHVIHASTP